MAAKFQLVIDCADADLMVRFWSAALGYVVEPPPEGYDTWEDWRRHIGLPEEMASGGPDSIIDPDGAGPRIWFHAVPETKTVKNRLHFDIFASGGWTLPMATRKERVDAEARRLVGLGAVQTCVLAAEGMDHYAVGMQDPEGNEFDIN
jgi:glyoxalase superfamily protein